MFEAKEQGFFVANPTRLKELKDQEETPIRLSNLEQENADLWYENMLKDVKIESAESEIAQLWYELMMGGI